MKIGRLALSAILALSLAAPSFAQAESAPYFRWGYGQWLMGIPGANPNDDTDPVVDVGIESGSIMLRAGRSLQVPITTRGLNGISYQIMLEDMPSGVAYADGFVAGTPTSSAGKYEGKVKAVNPTTGDTLAAGDLTVEVVGLLEASIDSAFNFGVGEEVLVKPEVENIIGRQIWTLLPDDDLPEGLSFNRETGEISGSVNVTETIDNRILHLVDQSDMAEAQTLPFRMRFAAAAGPMDGAWLTSLSSSYYTAVTGTVLSSDGSLFASLRQYRNSTVDDNYHAVIVKMSTEGEEIWSRTISGNRGGMLTDIAAGPGGSVYALVGYMTNNTHNGGYTTSRQLVKFSSGGNVEWQAPVPSNQFNSDAMASGPAGEVYILGRHSPTSGSPSNVILKYAAGGAFEWGRSWSVGQVYGFGNVSNADIITDDQGNVLVGGTWRHPTTGVYVPLVSAMMNDGTHLWTRRAGPSSNSLYTLGKTGNAVLVGVSAGNGAARVMRLSLSNGDYLGDTVVTNAGESYSLTAAPDGGFYSAAYTYHTGINTSKATVTKFAANGDYQWSRLFNSSGTDLYPRVVTDSEHLYMSFETGSSQRKEAIIVALPHANPGVESTAGRWIYTETPEANRHASKNQMDSAVVTGSFPGVGYPGTNLAIGSTTSRAILHSAQQYAFE